MTNRKPERGDIIVYKKKQSFPMETEQEWRTVVHSVDEDGIHCGVDGTIKHENVVEIQGKSPDYNPETDSFGTESVE
jgi:hypothetical protein